MPDERRKTARYSLDIPVGLHFPNGRYKEGWGRIIDVSAEGLRIQTRFPLKVAGVVYATFSLIKGSHFDNLRARVMRVSYNNGYHEVGISFDEVVDHETLREILAALVAEGGAPVV